MNRKISSKYLNLEALSLITNCEELQENIDGVLLLTSYGLIIGKLITTVPEDCNKKLVSVLIGEIKAKIIKSFEEAGDSIELVNDGSMITIEDAVVKSHNNSTLKLSEVTVFSDHIIGFLPVNISVILNQLK